MLSISIIVALGVVGIIGHVLGGYFWDQKRLRRFPSPSLSAYTPLWLIYHYWNGQRFQVIDGLHRKLGPVVRIAPNHVSFTDPRAYKDIYGHGSSVLKDDFYTNVAAETPSISQTTSKAEHSRKRKALSHVFSAREITAMEPRVMVMIGKLCRDLQLKSQGKLVAATDPYKSVDGAFDIRPWMNMFSYDVITDIFWSIPYGFLDNGNDICPSMTDSGKIKHVHAMDSFHSGARFNVMSGQLSGTLNTIVKNLFTFTHDRQAGIDFGGMAKYLVVKRLQNRPNKPDLFSSLPSEPSAKWPNPMPLDELVAESATMLDAGNDTTQTSLTNCIFHLARNSDKQKKLYDILIKSISLSDPAQPLARYSEQLQRIPYLRACLDENFRCKPPVSIGLPRKTVSPGATIAGHFIPADTVVSVPLYSLHHDEALFKDAWSFIPERWLGDDDENRDGWVTGAQEAKNLKDFVLPFSLGGRACIGRNLAYMELSMVIAALVLGFEWDLAEPGTEMEMIERFNCNPKGLVVRARVREGVNWVG